MDVKIIKEIESSLNKSYDKLSDIIMDPIFFSGVYSSNIIKDYEITYNKYIAINLYTDSDPDLTIYTSYPDLLKEPPKANLNVPSEYESIDPDTTIKVLDIHSFFYEKLWVLIKDISIEKGWWQLGDFVGFVHGDFVNFLDYYSYQEWANNSSRSLFLEKQIEIYKNGGFPYGWKGQYPEGNLLVYLPLYGEKLELIKKFINELCVLSKKKIHSK